MAEKVIYIKLFKNGESEIKTDTASAPLFLDENCATILNVEFPRCFTEETFAFKCFVGQYVKNGVVKDSEKAIIEFLLPKIDKKNIVFGFCAYQELNNEIIKYVKWQGVQYTAIGG